MPSVDKNVILHSHPEIEISFKFIPKILMSKECIHFFGPLCISEGLGADVIDTQRGTRTDGELLLVVH